MFEISKAARGEKRILVAVVLALPLIGSRLLYSVVNTFYPDKTFNLINGSAIVQAFMVILEEAIVVIMYALIGLTVHEYREGRFLTSQHPPTRKPTYYRQGCRVQLQVCKSNWHWRVASAHLLSLTLPFSRTRLQPTFDIKIPESTDPNTDMGVD
jgi:hypothetical protein